MFDIGWSELLVVGAIALIVVGPKDLPRMLRTFGKYTAQARGMARDFQRSMEDAAREADLSEMKDLRDTARQLGDLKRDMGGSALNPMRSGPYVPPAPKAPAGAGSATSAPARASVPAPMPPVAMPAAPGPNPAASPGGPVSS